METGRMTVLRVLWFREFNQVFAVGGKMETGRMPVLRRKQVFAVGRKKMETGKMPVLRRKQVFAVGRKRWRQAGCLSYGFADFLPRTTERVSMVFVVTAWMASSRWVKRPCNSVGSVTFVLSGGVESRCTASTTFS
jgi:hypothetical protein